eukprot:Seg2747.1 transcript_id=Seg2747.1/GoldUCD/mRNA.D3Y31 product="Zinc finger protein 271" protein_id=Seg2747.1/GoldUCD/D3Y31
MFLLYILLCIAGMNAFEMDAMSANDMNVMVYVCQNCGKGFQNGTELAEHNHIKHSSAKDKALNCNVSMPGIKVLEEDNATDEKDVGGTRDISSVKDRICKEDEFFESPAPSSGEAKDLNIHSDDVEEITTQKHKKSFRCCVCHEVFGKKTELRTHMVKHPDDNVKSTACNVCGKKFSHVSAMIKHQRIHSGEKPFQCDICNKAFNAMCNLVTHKRIHSGEKPYVCKECGKAFSVQCNLTTHSRIHSGEKPFPCDLCDKSFSVYHNMLIHKRIHSGEKPFICQVCGKAFSVQCNLVTHMRTHSGEKPYACETCGKSFRAQCNLNTHMHVHSTDKPHVCESCGRGFSRPLALDRHRKTHLKPKLFECAVCKRSFSNKSSLKRHEDIHVPTQHALGSSSFTTMDETTYDKTNDVGTATQIPTQFETLVVHVQTIGDVSSDTALAIVNENVANELITFNQIGE